MNTVLNSSSSCKVHINLSKYTLNEEKTGELKSDLLLFACRDLYFTNMMEQQLVVSECGYCEILAVIKGARGQRESHPFAEL